MRQKEETIAAFKLGVELVWELLVLTRLLLNEERLTDSSLALVGARRANHLK